MPKSLALLAGGTLLALAGCQSANVTYERIGPGPTLAYSQAQCDNASMAVEQGMFAMGSASYVAGAQLGNAIGNAIRKQQFVKNCMTMNGWQAVPVTTSQVAARRAAVAPAQPAQAVVTTNGRLPEPPPPIAR